MESEHARKGGTREESAPGIWKQTEQRNAVQHSNGRQRKGEGAAAATAGEGEKDAFVKWMRRGKGRQATSGT